MESKVTRTQAEKVLAEVKKMFPNDAAAFTLFPPDHEGMNSGCWSIAAEGVYEPITDCWPMRVEDAVASDRGKWRPSRFGEELFLEPLSSYSLGIYPH